MSTVRFVREACAADMDWEVTSSTAWKRRFTTHLNRALRDMLSEAPYVFFEEDIKLYLEPDVVPTLATDTITLAANASIPTPESDPWVFKTDLSIGTTDAIVWSNDRSWDGRIIELSDGTSFWTRTIRSVWKDVVRSQYRITINTPWPHAEHGAGPFTWRIYTDKYPLPSRFHRVKAMKATLVGRVRYASPVNFDNLNVDGQRSSAAPGAPTRYTLVSGESLPAPLGAPKVELDNDTRWDGPEPPGKFSYIVTYTLGKANIETVGEGLAYFDGAYTTWRNTTADASFVPIDNTHNRYMMPRLESSPSNASEEITTPYDTQIAGSYRAINVIPPNIEYMLGFLMKGTASGVPFARDSVNQSGIHVRVWRRRIEQDFAHYGALTDKITGLSNVGTPAPHFLLAEFRIDNTNLGLFRDTGAILPDYTQRIYTSGHQQYVRFHPQATDATEVTIRGTHGMVNVVDDDDVIPVNSLALNLIIAKTLIYVRRADGNAVEVREAIAHYESTRKNTAQQFGHGRPPGQSVRVGQIRARRRTSYSGPSKSDL